MFSRKQAAWFVGFVYYARQLNIRKKLFIGNYQPVFFVLHELIFRFSVNYSKYASVLCVVYIFACCRFWRAVSKM